MIRLVVVVETSGIKVEHRDTTGKTVATARITVLECRRLSAFLAAAADRFDEVEAKR